MIGGQPLVVVDQNGERVEYTRANSAQLRAYILELQRAIASNGTTIASGPMGVIF